jgi:trimeric autotransporter adhesin
MTIGRTLQEGSVVQSTVARVLLLLSATFALRCGGGEGGQLDLPASASRSATIAQTCTAANIRGFPIQGTICGGSTITSGCEPGAIYRCKGGNQGQTNNCTLQTLCAVGCGTNPNLSDSCYNGSAPLAVTPTSTAGGNEVTATVTLTEAHPKGAIDNFKIDRGDLIAARAFCNVLDVPAGSSSVSFNMPTAVVGSPTPVRAHTLLSFTTPSGFSRQVVSRPTFVTLNPGGATAPPPPIASFTLTPSSIAPGGVSFMDVTLAHMAPAQALPAPQGLPISVTSSDPAVVSVIANGQPVITPGCTKGGGAETLQAANQVSQTTTVTVSASSGAAGQSPVANPLTVTAGCTPKSCLDIPADQCSAPDGCGGTLACGCPSGEVCSASGTCQVQQQLAVSSITLNPSTVKGGTTSVGTVTLNMPSPPGGSAVFFNTSNAAAQPPSSVVLPEGATSANFNVTTSRVGSNTSATITASLGAQKTAVLTITP